MQDRRRITRWQIDRPAQIKLEGAEVFAEVKVLDINFKGIQISLKIKLPKDTFLNLKIVLSEEFSLDAEAWMVWQKTVDGHNIYGLYFSKISDSDKEKIYKFVYNNFPQAITKQWWQGLTETKGGETMEDRRVFARIASELPLRFLNLNSARESVAKTSDISAKGIGMVIKEELAPRTPLEIWLDMPDKGEPVYTRGEVVWSKKIEPDVYRAGVNLEKADLMAFARVLRAK